VEKWNWRSHLLSHRTALFCTVHSGDDTRERTLCPRTVPRLGVARKPGYAPPKSVSESFSGGFWPFRAARAHGRIYLSGRSHEDSNSGYRRESHGKNHGCGFRRLRPRDFDPAYRRNGQSTRRAGHASAPQQSAPGGRQPGGWRCRAGQLHRLSRWSRQVRPAFARRQLGRPSPDSGSES
jgi:hypothetical protein